MGLRLIMCLVTHQLPLSHSENPPPPADAVILQITYSPNAAPWARATNNVKKFTIRINPESNNIYGRQSK